MKQIALVSQVASFVEKMSSKISYSFGERLKTFRKILVVNVVTVCLTLIWKKFSLVHPFEYVTSGVGNLLLVTGQMSSVQLFGGPEFSLIL